MGNAAPEPEIRREIRITGVVQGVGFRPWIYRLAIERNLSGHILNTSGGVTIEVQGPGPTVEDFLSRLRPEAPPLSRIVTLDIREIPCAAHNGFHILKSHGGEEQKVLISPDVAVCADCLREMLDPGDRRYRYPFINCTNCGPRFTIVRDIPYDRPLTSMSVFPMCPECQREYEDPLNRRFHAQPNACWKCGPQVELWDTSGGRIEAADPITEAARRIGWGEVVAVKGLGGFHLAVDATNSFAVERLRDRKHRVEKPFAIMVPDLATAERFCEVGAEERAALESVQRPIVLLRRKETPDIQIADAVAPRNRDLGVFLPYTPVHYLLLAAGQFRALVMTSANLSEEPICIDNMEAVRRLGAIADSLLVHNREILIRSDDSVVRVTGGRMRQMRRSRGFVPMPIFLDQQLPPILAVGGELKNTVCLTRKRTAFLSQHIGDLENLESYGFFNETVQHLSHILEIAPQTIAYDLHPRYFSTQWALKQQGVRLVGVQHHHAHIASCMAENHLIGEVIGIALDGTGYGTDGKIWGGEVMVASYAGFQRAAHIEYLPLPGGEAAIHNPWRIAVGYLWHHFQYGLFDLEIPMLREVDRKEVEIVCRMVERNVNTPVTSSTGRLFDAVSALAGVRTVVNYEGQAAIELEMAMDGSADSEDAYPLPLITRQQPWTVSTRPLFEAILADLRSGTPVAQISRRFHNGFADALFTVAARIRNERQLQRICLSGGSFQNMYLLNRLSAKLNDAGFEVYTQAEVPCGDGGLALGQALIAAHSD